MSSVAAHYEDLMNAETQGKAGKKGQWSSKEPPKPHINDVSLPGTSARWVGLAAREPGLCWHHRRETPQHGGPQSAHAVCGWRPPCLTSCLFRAESAPHPCPPCRAKQHLPFLQRAGKVQAVCEYVLSGHRLKLHIPKEGVTIAFNPSGVRCPQRGQPASAGRPAVEVRRNQGDRPRPCQRWVLQPGLWLCAPLLRSAEAPWSTPVAGSRHGASNRNPGAPACLPCPARPQEEPYWEEALAFTRGIALQRDCELEVHSIDRAGNFQGAVRFGRTNLGGEARGRAACGLCKAVGPGWAAGWRLAHAPSLMHFQLVKPTAAVTSCHLAPLERCHPCRSGAAGGWPRQAAPLLRPLLHVRRERAGGGAEQGAAGQAQGGEGEMGGRGWLADEGHAMPAPCSWSAG